MNLLFKKINGKTTDLFHLQCPRFTPLALSDELYTKHIKRSITSSIQVFIPPLETKSTIHWTVYTGKLIYHFTTHGTRFVHSYKIFLMVSISFFFAPFIFTITKYTQTSMFMYSWTSMSLPLISGIYHWCVKVSRNCCSIIYIYLQLLFLDISKIYLSFGWLPLVPENKIFLYWVIYMFMYSSFIYQVAIYMIYLKALNYMYLQVFFGFTYLSLYTSIKS